MALHLNCLRNHRYIYLALSLIALLVIPEMVFRLAWQHKDARSTIAGLVVSDKDLIWKLQPFSDGPLKTNELGFRDTPLHANGNRRILLLGDSVSWGDGIESTEDVYPQILEKSLSISNGLNYEIVNSSVPGYSTFQQLTYLKLYGLSLKPKLIILQFCLNDVVERYLSVAQYSGDNVFLGIDTRQGIHGFFGVLVRRSRLFEAAVRAFVRVSRNAQTYKVEELAKDKVSDELIKAWELTLSEVEGIRQVALQNGIPFLIVIAPYRFQLKDPLKYNQPQNILKVYGEKNGVKVYDLLPVFSTTRQYSGVELFNDDNHFSIFGHSLAARALFLPVQSAIEEIESYE